MDCQRCLLCDSQDPGIQKAQLAAQRDVPLEDMGSVGSAGTDRVSTPFSLSQVGMEPSRSFQELHRGSAPPFLSARWGKRLPGASRSLADQSIPVRPSGGAGHGFSCSAPSPRIGGIKATLPQTQQDAGGILSGCTAPRRSFPVTRAESLGMSWLFMLWENRANAERRLGGTSHSLNNESQLLPASHFFPQFPAPAENWVPSEAKLPLGLFHQ